MRRSPTSRPTGLNPDATRVRADVDRASAMRGGSEVQRAASLGKGPQRVLAEQTRRAPGAHVSGHHAECADSPQIDAESPYPLAERPASAVRGALQRGSKEREATAGILDDVLSRRAERGDESCSTRAVAHRCKTNPRVLHEYRHAEKLAPWALAWVLPIEVVEEINESIMAKRGAGRSWRWAIGLVRRGIDWIEERGVRSDDRDEASAALVALQSRLVKAIARVNQEGTR